MKRKSLLYFACQLAWLTPYAQDAKQALSWHDVPNWQYIRMNGASPSQDGNWFAYVSGPTQGDLTLTLKKTQDTTSYQYKIGGQQTPIFYNNNSQFIGFYESPSYKEIKANEKAKKPSSKKLKIVSLKDTASVVFDKVQTFNFSNDDNKWVAIRFEGTPSSPGAPRSEDIGRGTDLLLYNLVTKKSLNIGNVTDYRFNKSGQYLAYTVDANGKNGNGVFLMNMQTGLITPLHNDKANFTKLNWNKEGTAFAVLKSKKDKKYKSPVYTLVGVKNIQLTQPEVYTFDGLDENNMTAGHGISENTIPYWSKEQNTIFFGIAKLEKAEDPKSTEKKIDNISKEDKKATAEKDSVKAENSTKIANKSPEINKKDLEKPDMIIWNWQDKRLQSLQRTQLMRDKSYTTMSAWHVKENKFTSLADSSIKSLSLSPNQLIGLGFDFTPYEYEAGLSGQRYADIYLIDIKSGSKTLAVKNIYMNAARGFYFSPNSEYLLYYKDGHYYTLNTKSLQSTNITKNIPTTFVDAQDDHNVEKVATGNYGWTADGKYVLLKDNFDVWKISLDGKQALALTDNWKNKKLATLSYNNIYEDDEFIDLKKDQYFHIINQANKQKGIALLAANSSKVNPIKLDDINMSPLKRTKQGNLFFYTKEQSHIAPEYFFSKDKNLANEVQLTSNTPDSQKYGISAGSKLITYVSDHGDTLQATLYLPANYVEGQSYPTITYIYERLTDEKNNFSQPAFPGGGFNRAMYTSNGYAVLMPDIKYKLNDPGMSAVACVIPAVKAAIKTGIVDEKNVAIHGHSWGGYQTSFLITQTNIFKAAVAGAPLTNMISMYSLIYWNSGSSNQSIFESSQGRLTTGYWDNWEAYTRNSPIYHIKKVNTPLIIMHNDKDGAVDYTQGIEYYNGLRRLGKPVVMLSYNGENHGLAKEVNKKDYAVRMMEYFDHYLKGKPAPTWWSKGVDYMDLSKHLEERAF